MKRIPAVAVAFFVLAVFANTSYGQPIVTVFINNNNPARGVGYFLTTSQATPLPVIDGDTINLVPSPSVAGATCKSAFSGVAKSPQIVNADSLFVSGLHGLVEIPYQCSVASGAVGKGSAWIQVVPQVSAFTMVTLAVENAASFELNLFDGQPIAPYSLISIFGDGFSSSQPATPLVQPLPTQLNGVSVVIGGVAAPLLYVSRTQINAQVPALATGKYTLQVLSAGKNVAGSQITIVKRDPELFRFNNNPITQYVTPAGAIYNLPNSPAVPYDPNFYYIVWYGTGMGEPTPFRSDALPGLPSPSNPPATKLTGARFITYINNEQLLDGTVVFLGAAPGFSGLDQINIAIPRAKMDAAAKANGGTVGLTVLYQQGSESGIVGSGLVYVRQ